MNFANRFVAYDYELTLLFASPGNGRGCGDGSSFFGGEKIGSDDDKKTCEDDGRGASIDGDVRGGGQTGTGEATDEFPDLTMCNLDEFIIWYTARMLYE